MPTILVFSDIHANLEALQAVLDHAQHTYGEPDRIWCLGDLVGYGPDPAACLDLLRGGHPLTRAVPPICIKGNHDLGTVQMGQGQHDETTSSAVRESWDWTFRVLNEDQRAYLAQLPERIVVADLPQSALLVHAAPPSDLNKYLRVPADVEASLDYVDQRLCFFGHTHLACYFECNLERREVKPRIFGRHMSEPIKLTSDVLFLNPGAVGQPRWGQLRPKRAGEKFAYPLVYEGVPEASYVWLDLQADACAVRCHYVSYPHEDTVMKLRRLTSQSPVLNVPERWIDRLATGLR